jgi:D-alanyl-D-alanine carboxypeptidase
MRWLLVAVAVFAPPALAGPQADRRAPLIDSAVAREMKARGIPGLAYAVIDRGKITLRGTHGVANLETESPVVPGSVFELASLTKQFTAACIMLLSQDGKLRLDDSISKYIDEAPDAWRGITIRHLLTHTAGLSIDAIPRADGSPLLDVSTRQAFAFVAHQPVLGPPETRWSYSDAGYFLLGMVVERVSGMSYRDFVQQRVFNALGMKESSVVDRWRIVKNHVSVYSRRGDGLVNWRRDWQYELPSFFGILSTVDDLAKWDNALRGRALLTETSLQQMWTPATLVSGDDAWPEYGFGFNLAEMRGHRVAEHAGASGTFLLHVVDIPVSVLVLTNLDASGGPNAAAIARMIASMYDTSLALPRPLDAPSDPSPATTRAIDQLLSDLSQGHDSPVMTASHKSFYATLPAPNRDGLARQLASRSALTFLGDDDVSSRGIRISVPVSRIAYYRATVNGAPLYFTFYLTRDGKVAQMRLSPQ